MKKSRSKSIILICIVFFLSNYLEGQVTNKIFIGEKIYDATEVFEVGSRSLPFYKTHLQIVKVTNSSAFIIFKKNAVCNALISSNSRPIGGTTFIYLEDNSIIKLIDRGKFDCANNTFSIIYNLTSSEIDKLKKSNIHSIRLHSLLFNEVTDAQIIKHEEPLGNFIKTDEGVNFEKVEKTNSPLIFSNIFK